MRDGEEFAHSEQRLQQFLLQQGHTAPIVWTFFEDYLWHRGTLLAAPVDPTSNRSISRMIFNDTATYPFGVELTMILGLEPGATAQSVRQFLGLAKDISIAEPGTRARHEPGTCRAPSRAPSQRARVPLRRRAIGPAARL
jgi:hypothetical protein